MSSASARAAGASPSVNQRGRVPLSLHLLMARLLHAILWLPLASAIKGVVYLGPYPGVVPGASGHIVGGTLLIEDVVGAPEPLITMSGLLTGLGGTIPAGAGGWHIHTGFTCAVAEEVGGHYFPAMPTDPWNAVTYGPSDAQGVANIRKSMAGFSLSGTNPVLGRAVVVHDVDGARVGCGLIEPLAGEVRCLEQRLLSPHLATSRAISDESLVVSRANLAPISRQSRAIPPRVERRLHPHRHRRHHRRVEGRVGEVGARPRRAEEEGAWRVLARRGEASYWLRSGGRREAEPECSSRREGGLLTTAARAAGGDRRSQSRRRRRPTRSRSAGRCS